MKLGNFYNSKFFKIFDYCLRLVLINLLVIIPSFLYLALITKIFPNSTTGYWSYLTLIPIVLYTYPSICAAVDLIVKYELKLTNGVFKEFFKSFKKVIVKGLLEAIILSILVILFLNSFVFFYSSISKGIIYLIGFALSIAFSVFLLCIIIHLPLVMAYFPKCRIIDDIKLAGMMAFKDLAISIALVIVCGFIVFIGLNFDIFIIFCGASLPLYLIVKLTYKKYFIVYYRTIKDLERNE